MYVIPFLLGESALRRQDWTKAAEQLQRCLELNPNFDNAMSGLARALAKLGHVDDAKKWLNKALQSNPQNYRAWYQIGLLAASDPPAAQSAYEKAIAIQPNFPPGQRELGLLHFRQKHYAEAVARLERAAELGIKDAPLFNFLGIAYSRTGQVRRAVESYRKAIAEDPDLAEAHLNLAYAYQTLKQPVVAGTEYKTACRLQKNFCQYVPENRP
jgi:Tfp pilus assembly protein PilF